MFSLNQRILYTFSLGAWLFTILGAVLLSWYGLIGPEKSDPLLLKLGITSFVLFSYCLVGVIAFRSEVLISGTLFICFLSTLHAHSVGIIITTQWELDQEVLFRIIFCIISYALWVIIIYRAERFAHVVSTGSWFIIDKIISKTEKTYDSMNRR